MRKKKINLIHLIANSDYTGGPIQLMHLIHNLDRTQFSNIIIAPAGFLTEKLRSEGFVVYEFDFLKRSYTAGKLIKIIKNCVVGRDIIHCHGVKAGHLGRLANRKLKMPLVYTEHNWTKDYRLPQNWRAGFQLRAMKSLNKYTTYTVCVSQAVQDFLLKKKIVTPEDSGVIYNGVKFKEIARRKEWDPVVLGVIGSLHRRKGQIYLFEALAKLKKLNDGRKYVLKLVGAGPEEGFLKQHSVELGVNFDIQWLGVKEDLTDFWSSINIYVQPSLDESFGMSVAEAMGNKIPVIATNAGALPEIVDETGLLVNPANSDQLVKAIQNVVNNKTIREENIEKAYDRVKSALSVETMVKNYSDLYMHIAGLTD